MPLAFCLLNPHLLRDVKDIFETIFGLILPLHFFSNLEKIDEAAETDTC